MVALQRPNGMNFYCFANGKLVEEYGQPDLLTLPQQIGTVPKEIALSRARRHRNRGRGIHSLPESPTLTFDEFSLLRRDALRANLVNKNAAHMHPNLPTSHVFR